MAIDLNSTNNIHRFDFPSHRLPISSELYENQNINEDDHCQIQDTVPVDGPGEETQLCNLGFDTELLYDSDHHGGGEKTMEPLCQYEEEIVLDSEDEAINGSRLVAVNKSLHRNEAEKESGQRCDDLEGSGVLLSCFGKEKYLHEQPACEGELVRLNNKITEEVEEWSQAEALGFVDHFVLNNKFDMSQGTDYGKTCKEKSPVVPSAKGPRNLARRINQQTQIKVRGMFEFIENDPRESLDKDSFRKKTSFSRYQSDMDVDFRGYMSLGDGGRDKNGTSCLDKQSKDLSDLDEGFAGNSSKDGSEMAQVYEANAEVDSCKELELTGKKLEGSDMVSDSLDIYDIGFNTQIAAEAIEALAYGHPFGHGSDDACQDMENNMDGSLKSATENNAQLKPPLVQTSGACDLGDVLEMAKRKKRSDRSFGRGVSSLSKKGSGVEVLDPELAKMRLMKRSRFSVETGLCGSKSANSCESSGRGSLKPIEQREEGVIEKNNTPAISENMISATPIQNILLKKMFPFSSKTRQQDSGVRLNRNDKRSSNREEKMNNNMERCVIVYRRKGSRLNAKPLNVLTARGKGSKLCSLSEGARKSILNVVPKSDMWNCPKGKRTSRKRGKHFNRNIKLNIPFNSYNHERSIGKANMMDKPKSASCTRLCSPRLPLRNDFPENLSGKSSAKPNPAVSNTVPAGSECITSVAVGAEKDHTSVTSSNKTLDPSGSKCTTISSTTGKNVVPSKNTYNHYRKRPYQKNVPKISLLKELINLGVPEQISEFRWKELRRRRDMAHVRVLFSQHLDDDIINQQKKLAARLGTSLASCLTDATHFLADKFARTKNMLEAIALGKPVVTHQWLESCGQANCFIDERNYILRDAKKEKEFGFSMPVSLARANQHPLLKGQRVFVTPNVKPEREMIINLIKAVNGQSVEKLRISELEDENIPEGLLILSCKEDHSICLPFLKKGSPVYSSELLLNGIVTQKLEYKRYQLFANDVKRNCS